MVGDALLQGGPRRAFSEKGHVGWAWRVKCRAIQSRDKYCGQRPPGRSSASQEGHI